jgi:hypothetical protein
MTPFLEKIVSAGRAIIAALGRLRGKAEVAFLSKAESTRRAAGRLEARQQKERKEFEVERLDRIRNPSNYQGR